MVDFKLTGSQRAAVDAFRVFLAGPDQVFMLKGAAGTGKTTIVSQFLNVLESARLNMLVVAKSFILPTTCFVTSPTGKLFAYSLFEKRMAAGLPSPPSNSLKQRL